MTVWLVRAGKHGEHEHKFLGDNRVYLTWDRLAVDLAKLDGRRAVFGELERLYGSAKPKRLHTWAAQVWSFAHRIEVGDLVAVPLKTQPAIAMADVAGPYAFDSTAPNPYYHARAIKNVTIIPRQAFPQDLLYSMGSVLTICEIRRNSAEGRIRKLVDDARRGKSKWQPRPTLEVEGESSAIDEEREPEDIEDQGTLDLEQAGRDQIAQRIEARFKGHGLTRLVDGILRAQGYTTWVSPEGADGGADILAGLDPLGFGKPQLCVEVKSQTAPVDRPTVDKLIGAVTKFGAEQGLFIAWGGYKANVQRDLARQFFHTRLWTRDDLLAQLFAHYDRLDPELRAELPLKRVWTIASQDDE